MKYTILCYGDSNTYGYVPAGGGKRYDEDTRWTCLLQKQLGNDYHVIEEGCGGRTTDVDDPDAPWKNGMSGLLISLHSHKPIDLIAVIRILMPVISYHLYPYDVHNISIRVLHRRRRNHAPG